MVLIPVNSTALRTIGYDGHTLTVAFHTGHVHDHSGVPDSVYQGLMNAASKGFYNNHYIRGRCRQKL